MVTDVSTDFSAIIFRVNHRKVSLDSLPLKMKAFSKRKRDSTAVHKTWVSGHHGDQILYGGV
jgi:hypothetical protein